MVAGGISIRSKSPSPTQGFYEKGLAEKLLINLMRTQGLNEVTTVHFTADTGIKGLQVSMHQCNGYLAILVMPDGDELSGLWQKLANQVGYTTKYLFDGVIYNSFPRTVFWMKTTLYSLARKITTQAVLYPGPALAIAHPKHCEKAENIPFNHIVF
ncbi:hypothetical protein [Candidatus Enterovibrio escicola]|nr:hypothetical protein [Candidatus Enterovibrio escacola]